MSTLDFSANLCHSLSMPFQRARDPRKRLDARVGASCDIYNSRLYVYGGCVLPISLPVEYTLETIKEAIEKEVQGDSPQRSFNDYLSSECFSLSMVSRTWGHYKTASGTANDEVPRARMFHSSAVHDGYIYIRGGIAFDENNNPVLLNDLWRFDTIDRKWNCYYKNGNKDIARVVNDLSVYTSGLDLIGKPTHCGFMSVGGLVFDDDDKGQVAFFDLVEKEVVKHDKNFVVSSMLKDSDKGTILQPLNSKDAIIGIECEVREEILFLVYNKSPNPDTHYPLITIHKDGTANRLPAAEGFHLDAINNLEYPTLGKFGKNFVVVGFEKGKDTLSSFVYNYPSNLWTKLNISCMHKANTHKLSMGFVWGSHHKVVFLGTKVFSNQPRSVQFFDTMIVLALPFTNIFSADVYKSEANSALLSRSPSLSFNNDAKVSEKENSSSNLNILSTHPAIPPLVSHLGPGSQGLSGGFAEYSHHVAQQIQVNSIQTILPPYAIAIGKDAFQRTDAFSDFSMVCADGSVVPGQFTLCRRRWGPVFDVMLADAYAKALAETNLRENQRENIEPSIYSKSSNSNTSCDSISIASRSSDAAPHFRYPFKEKDQGTQVAASNDSDENQNSRKNSIRRTSLTYVTPNPAAQRASISLSQSRRNSYNVGSPSRHNSISLPSRKNSLTLRQQCLPNSRRGSALSRASVISSTSTSSAASPNFKPAYASSNDVNLPVMTPISDTNEHREQPINTKMNPNDDVFVKYLPETLSMPEVMPNGDKPQDDAFEELNLSDVFASKMNPRRPGSVSEPGDLKGPFGNANQQGNNERSNIPSTPNANIFSFSQNVSPLTGGGDAAYCSCNVGNSFNAETNIHFGRLPRALFLPFSKPVVLALNEYLYSGQVGANWKLFPTAIELLVASKRLGIPLLYDLLLDILFVVLGLMENRINNKIAMESVKKDVEVTMCEHAGVGDYDLYCQLLCNFSKEIRRTSGSTLGSSFVELDDNEQLKEEINISVLQDDDLGPTDGGFNIKSNDNKEGVKSNIEDDDGESYDNSFADYTSSKVRAALCLLDDSGFETSGSEDEESDDSFEDRFRKFTMKDEKPNKGKSHKVKKEEWPTVKEILCDNSKFLISRTLIEIFVELGTIINDSNLLVRALHVKELRAKLDTLKEGEPAETPVSGRNSAENTGVRKTSAAKQDHVGTITPVNSAPPLSASPFTAAHNVTSLHTPSAKLSPFSTSEAMHDNDENVAVERSVPIAKSKTVDATNAAPGKNPHHHHVHTLPHLPPPPNAPKLMKSAKSFKGVMNSFMPKENDSVDELFGSTSMRPSMSQTSLHKKPRGLLSRITGRNKN